MTSFLFLNNTYYRTLETPDHQDVIYWSCPLRSIKEICRLPFRSFVDDFNIIEFKHCGMGRYHCHMPEEDEKRLRDLDKEKRDD